MFEKSHIVSSQTPSGYFPIPSDNLFTDLSTERLNGTEKILQELLFTLITEGIRNHKGRFAYAVHEITWELRTGDESMSKLHNDIDNIINSTIDEFRHIPQVNTVKHKLEDKKVLFNIFVNMPKYNDKLMDALIDIEIASIKKGLAQNYSFDFSYIPI